MQFDTHERLIPLENLQISCKDQDGDAKGKAGKGNRVHLISLSLQDLDAIEVTHLISSRLVDHDHDSCVHKT